MEFKKSNIEIINRLHQLSWLKKQDRLEKPEETMGKRAKRNQKRNDQKSTQQGNSYPALVEENQEPEVELNPANNVWLKDDSASAAVVLFPKAMDKHHNCNLDESEQMEMAVMLSMIMAKEEGYESPTKTKVKAEGYVVIDDDGDSEWGARKEDLPTKLEEPKSEVVPQEKNVTKTDLPREKLEDFNKRLLLNPGSSKMEENSAERKRRYQALEDRKYQNTKKEERKKVVFSSEVMDKENGNLNKYPVSPKPTERTLNIDEEEDFSFVKPVVEKVKKALHVIEEEDSVADTDEERSSVNGDAEVQNKAQEEVVEVKRQDDIAEEVKVQIVLEEKSLEETSDSVEGKGQEDISEELKDQEEIPEGVNGHAQENVLEKNCDSEVQVQDVLLEEKGQDNVPISEVQVQEVIVPEEKVQEDIPEERIQEEVSDPEVKVQEVVPEEKLQVETSDSEVKVQEVVPEKKHKEETSDPEVKVQEEISDSGVKVQDIVPEEKVQEEISDSEVKDQETVPEEKVEGETPESELDDTVLIETIQDSVEDAHQEIPSSDFETKEQVPEGNSLESEIPPVVQKEEVQLEIPDSKIDETLQVLDFKTEENPEDVAEEKICEEKVAKGVQDRQHSDEISAREIVELKDATIQNDSKILETSSEEKEEKVIPEMAAERLEKEETDDQKKENLEEPGPAKKLEQETPEQKKEEEAARNVSRESRIPTRSRPISRVQNSDEEKNFRSRENIQQMKSPFGFNKNPPRHSTMFPKDNSRPSMFRRDNQKPSTMFPKDGRRDSRKDSREPRRFPDTSGLPRDSRPSRDSEKTEPGSNENFQQQKEPRSNFRDSRQFRDNDSREPRGNFRDSRTLRDAEPKPREHQDAQSQRQGRDFNESRATSRDSRGFARGPRDRWPNSRDNRCPRQTETDNVGKPQQPEKKADGRKDEDKVDLRKLSQEGQKVEQVPLVAKVPSQEVPQVGHTTLSSDSVEFVPNSQQKKENPQVIRPLMQEEPKESPKEQLQPSTAEFVPQYDRAPYREYGEASSEAYKMAPSEETYKMAPVYRHPVDYYPPPPPHYKVPQQYYMRPSEYVPRYPHFVQGYPPEGMYSPEGYPQGMPNYAFEAPEFPRSPLPKPRDHKNYPRQNLEAASKYHPSQALGKEHQGYYKQQTSLLASPPRPPPGFYQRAPPQKSFGHVGERRGEKRGGPNERSGYGDREMMGGCEERPLISPKTLMTTQFEAPPLQLHVREPNPGQGNRNMSRVCAGRGRGYSATKVPFPRRYNN